MSLDNLINDKSEDNSEESKSLFDISRVKYQKEKLNEPELCPGCGSNNTEEAAYGRRCLESPDDCEVITYIPTDYKLDGDLMK